MRQKKKKRINGKKSLIYTLDAALAVLFALVILFAVNGYIGRINYNKVLLAQPAEIGSDVLNILQRGEYLNDFYIDNQWFFNRSIIDSQGANHGTLNKSAELDTAKDDYYDYWLSLDGVDDYANITCANANGIYGGAYNVSISAWVKVKDDATRKFIYHDAWENDETRLSIELDGNEKVKVYARSVPGDSNGDQTLLANNAVAADTWQHIAVVVDASQGSISIFVNGALDNSGSATFDETRFNTSAKIHKTRIGSNVSDESYFNGLIDDMQIFNKNLTTSQVNELYNKQPVTEGLLAKYDFNIVTKDLNNSIDTILPSQYVIVVQMKNNESKIIANSKKPYPSSINNFIVSAERIIAVNQSKNIVDFAKARSFIWVK